MPALRWVHCRYCGQTFLSDDMEKCSACNAVGGMIDPKAPGVPPPLPERKIPQADLPPLTTGLRDVMAVWSWIKWAALGVICLIFGIVLMVDPNLRKNPRQFTLDDAALGIVVCLIGVLILGGVILAVVVPRQPAARNEQRSAQDEQT
jgi:hypothetical protein